MRRVLIDALRWLVAVLALSLFFRVYLDVLIWLRGGF